MFLGRPGEHVQHPRAARFAPAMDMSADFGRARLDRRLHLQAGRLAAPAEAPPVPGAAPGPAPA